jgi:ribosomal protein S18 acetylase RimI-like enzyme
MKISYRPIRKSEYGFLRDMLYEALFVPVGEERHPKAIVDLPEIRKYVSDWNPEKGDVAIVALVEGELIGAIWARRFKPENKGYGYVDPETPEISMAIKQVFRNQGIGTELLKQIAHTCQERGADRISLSVDKRNPAKQLYLRSGFEFYEDAGTAFTMVKSIAAADAL